MVALPSLHVEASFADVENTGAPRFGFVSGLEATRTQVVKEGAGSNLQSLALALAPVPVFLASLFHRTVVLQIFAVAPRFSFRVSFSSFAVAKRFSLRVAFSIFAIAPRFSLRVAFSIFVEASKGSSYILIVVSGGSSYILTVMPRLSLQLVIIMKGFSTLIKNIPVISVVPPKFASEISAPILSLFWSWSFQQNFEFPLSGCSVITSRLLRPMFISILSLILRLLSTVQVVFILYLS